MRIRRTPHRRSHPDKSQCERNCPQAGRRHTCADQSSLGLEQARSVVRSTGSCTDRLCATYMSTSNPPRSGGNCTETTNHLRGWVEPARPCCSPPAGPRRHFERRDCFCWYVLFGGSTSCQLTFETAYCNDGRWRTCKTTLLYSPK